MYSLSIIISFFSIWCLYSISEKVEYTKKGITLILSRNTRAAKIAALVFFLVSTILLSISLGQVSGIFTSLVVWITLASFTLLFTPFSKVKRLHLILIGTLIICIELLFSFIS